MAAEVRSQPWLANRTTRASVLRVGSSVALVAVEGIACSENANPATRIYIRVMRANIDTGSYALGAADQRAAYTAFGTVLIAGREFRSDLSDNLGTGTGTVRFTTIAADRVRGTFEFVAVPTAGAGARDRARVTTGTFDIPVTP